MNPTNIVTKNKVIPREYKDIIIKALKHFPELNETRIAFKLTNRHSELYHTGLGILQLLLPAQKRKYVIALRDRALKPDQAALFKNLPREAQIGVIAHELGHLLHLKTLSLSQVLSKLIFGSSDYEKRNVHRTADLLAIGHDLGSQLHVLSVHLTKINELREHGPELEANYLKPHEILQGLGGRLSGIGA